MILFCTQRKDIHRAHICPTLLKVNDHHHQESSGARGLTMQRLEPLPEFKVQTCQLPALCSWVSYFSVFSIVKRTTLVKNLNGLSWHLVGTFNWPKWLSRGRAGLWKLKVCPSHSLIGTDLNWKIEDLKE